MALKKKKQRIMHLVMASAHAALVGCGSMYHVIQKLPPPWEVFVSHDFLQQHSFIFCFKCPSVHPKRVAIPPKKLVVLHHLLNGRLQ